MICFWLGSDFCFGLYLVLVFDFIWDRSFLVSLWSLLDFFGIVHVERTCSQHSLISMNFAYRQK